MNKRKTPVRTLAAAVFAGVAVGSVLTLTSLSLIGVRLQPGLTTPAFNKFFAAYEDLNKLYYFPATPANLLDGAISGMTKSLNDPFTDYFTPSAAQQFQNYLSNSFDGIGVLLEASGLDYVIASVTANSPAEKAGLLAHDVINKVDGKPIHGLDIQQVSQLIMGKAGTQVVLTISRPGTPTPLQVTVRRGKITAPTATSKMLPGHVGYLAISVIGAQTANEVGSALHSLTKQGATRLIVDLRSNGGGYLDQAELIANQLIPAGKIVVQTQGRGQAASKVLSKGPGLNMPVVVLINQDTASAAEVLAAALHDDIGAPLVGTTSYGKGTVQETQGFFDGSALKYTVARWLTPTGGFWVQHHGLTPTVTVKLPDYVSLPSLLELKTPLQQGDNSGAVATVQKALQALGLRTDRTDGYFDLSTKQAVARFQSSVRLPANGVFDSQTASFLQNALDKRIAESDTQLQKAEQLIQAEKG